MHVAHAHADVIDPRDIKADLQKNCYCQIAVIAGNLRQVNYGVGGFQNQETETDLF